MSEFVNTIDLLGDDAVVDSIIDRTIAEFKDNQITVIGTYAFYACGELTVVNTPNVTGIGASAFQGCTNLVEVDFPNVRYGIKDGKDNVGIGKNAFSDCTSLKKVRFESLNKFTSAQSNAFAKCTALNDVHLPNLTETAANIFTGCLSLEKIVLPSLTYLAGATFSYCHTLKAVVLPNETIAQLGGTNTFNQCYHILGTTNSKYNPNGLSDGYIYVPRTLVDSYKAATNWSTFATQFRALEDYTVDGTITGDLDESKI